ncbi:hypothetical protein DENSPDRAFT_844268 [Dentipellis sp. KUC8613]|nr:hypothetical protein DENSPDRAFT_844268 [Dentipellis sp. KUC8613]
MNPETEAGAVCLSQTSVTRHNERTRTHRGLPIELLREIVLITFANYFPDLCIDPEFDTSWDDILSLLHASRLLRDITISILKYVLGDVFMDPQTQALRNYKPVIKELHELAVVHAKEPLEIVHEDAAYKAATQHHSDCLLSWHARAFGISVSIIRHGERSTRPLLYPESSRSVNAEITKLSKLHSVPSYITDTIFDSMNCFVLIHLFAHVKGIMLSRLCAMAEYFGSWIHRNRSVGIVTDIPSGIEAVSREYQAIVSQLRILRDRLLIRFAVGQRRVPKLSEAQIREAGFFKALSVYRCPPSFQDGDVRIGFCMEHRKDLLCMVLDESDILRPILDKDPGPPDTSDMPVYPALGATISAETHAEDEEEA